MAGHLVAAGYDVLTYDPMPGVSVPGARRAHSVREVGDAADIVLVCVPDAGALRDVVLDEGGLAGAARVRVLVHTGTSGPEVLDELAGRVELQIVDAPITGGVPRARTGDLTTIVAGAAEVVALVRPLLETYSAEVVVISERAGDGQRAKLVNNLLSASNLALACEAFVLGERLGLDPEALLQVVNSGSGQNSATLTKIPDNVLPRRFNRGGRISMLLKDLDAARSEAERVAVPMPLAAAVRSAFAEAIAQDGPDGDSTSVVRHMARAAGLEDVGRE